MNLRNFLIAALLTGAALYGADNYRFFRDPQSPRRILIGKEKTSVLFDKGKVNFEIVPGKTAVARFAANELAKQLSRVLGVKIAPVAKASGKVPALIVGDAAFAKKLGLDPAKLDRDGFYIKSAGRDVIIIGEDDPNANPERHGYFRRGTLFGVYDFLERFAGVRYYFPGDMGTVAPRLTKWALPKIDITDRPDSQYRQVYAVYSGPKETRSGYLYPGFDERTHYRDREYQLRLLTHGMHSTHGLAYLGLKERFAKSHPEYFALNENNKRYNGTDVSRCPSDAMGQICFSQEGLKQEVIKDGIALLSGAGAKSRGAVNAKGVPYTSMRPDQAPFFCIMPNDSMAPCCCPGCAPHFVNYRKHQPDQKCSDFVWNWMIDVAEAIRKSGVPGYVTTMCYNPFHRMPKRAIPDNVIVRMALPGPWVNDAKLAEDMAKLKAWRDKCGGRICLWLYMINAGQRNHFEIPHMTPLATGRFMKKTAKDSFGAFLETENVNYLAAYLNYYVFAKVAWDTAADVPALLEEHDRLMFGPGAPFMKQVRESWERNWTEKITGNVLDTPLGPVNVAPSKTELWERIYDKKELDRISGLFDRAEKACAKAPEALARVKFIRKQIWQRTLDGAAAFWRQFDDRESWQAFMPERKGPVVIDGKLTEKDWQEAPAVWMLSRNLGKDKSGKVEVQTKVKMLYDKDFFYFGFICDEPLTGSMTNLPRKFDDGSMWVDNIVEIFLAPDRKAKGLYQFMITSNNSACDLRNFSGKTDYKWNSGMVSQVSVEPGKAWYAEVKIPRKSMPEIKGARFAGNFTRGRKHNDARIHAAVPYYTWSAFGPQTPENCGIINLGQPKQTSHVKDGDFAIVMRWQKGKYRSPWYGPRAVWMDFDNQYFRTCGASLIMDARRNTLSQWGLNLKPATKYRLSFYVKLEEVKPLKASGGLTMRIGFTSNRSIWPLARPLHGTADWRRYVFDVTTPPNVGDPKRAAIVFSFRDASGRALLDGISLTEIK